MNGLKLMALLALLWSSNCFATNTIAALELREPEFDIIEFITRPEPGQIQQLDLQAMLSPNKDVDDAAALLAKAKTENTSRARMRQAQLTQTECLATAMYHEARGEGIIGMKAVAFVIYNRMMSSRFPKDACGVVLQKSQFSFVSDRNPDNIKSWDVYAKALELAVQLFDYNGFQKEKSPVGSALFFNSLALSRKALYSTGRKYVATIGNHNFFR